jgi:hypothetical protein
MTNAITLDQFNEFRQSINGLGQPLPPLALVDHGLACVGKPPATRAPPGTKVRVAFKLGTDHVVQCRPGIVTKTRGHMGPGWVYVNFPEGNSIAPGAWFQRNEISLDDE